MPFYAEHWTALPAWMALSIQERIDYLDALGPRMDRLKQSGAILIGAVLRESQFLHRSDTHYVAHWVMPEGASQIQMLASILEEAGWGRYFKPAAVDTTSQAPAKTARPPTRELRRQQRRLNGRHEE